MKSILFYITRYPGYGGIENITTLLANHLLMIGYKVSILSFIQQDEINLLNQLNHNVSFYKLPNKANINAKENQYFLNQIVTDNNITTIIYQDCYFPNENLLLNVTNRNNINIICVEHTAPDCSIKGMKHGIKQVPWYNFYQIVKILFFNILGLKRAKKRKQTLYNFCNKYVVLSKGYIPIFLKLNHIKNSTKILAIENPISIPISENLNEKENICLFVGRFSPEKGLKYLLKIWQEIEKSSKYKEWKLIMVGDGPERIKVESYIKNNKLTRVQLEGFQSNVSDYYKRASILCMTSIFEGFPLTLPEAMSNGVIPIAFNSFAAISDIIDHKNNGILINPFNTRIYTENLIKLIEQPTYRKQLAKNAILKAQNFLPNLIWNKWEKII